VAILAIVAVASVGTFTFLNKPVNQPTNSVSLMTSSLQATISSSTLVASTTSIQSSPVQWITIEKVQSVNYYLTLLQSNGTQPYVQLGQELQELPDYSNATAVAEITYLALNATNPEVKEAFELMLKGGTADPSDFHYPIPQYNTELQILYWLANGRQLKYDDTLALAIAMSNGIWVTVGDGSVQAQIKKDAVELLDFFRETDALQQSLGYLQLEQMPLEAKVALAWLGADAAKGGPHGIWGSQTKHDSTEQRLTMAGYEWDNVNVTILRQMRDRMKEMGWISQNIDQTVANVEDYFFFSGFDEHFKYVSSWDSTIQVNGETVASRNLNNANFEFSYYSQHGYAIGVCTDEMTLVNAFLKSWGIATLPFGAYWFAGNWYDGHIATMYYEPVSRTWKLAPYQVGIFFYNDPRDAYITIPPVLQNDWVPTGKMIPNNAIVKLPFQNGETNTKMVVPMYNITASYLNRFARGVSSTEMKQVILYKISPPVFELVYEKWNPDTITWNLISGSNPLFAQNGSSVGDFGQPYVILTNVSYSYANGSIFFLFGLNGKIPTQTSSNVTQIWYQVLLDADSDSSTGYHWSSDFTPDFTLQTVINYNGPTKAPTILSDLEAHCGGNDDYCWTPVGFTQRFGPTTLISGGIGEDFLVLTCEFQDIQMQGFTVRFFARGGILYNGQPYADPVPFQGTTNWVIPATATAPADATTQLSAKFPFSPRLSKKAQLLYDALIVFVTVVGTKSSSLGN
jgi:hypothetical protein